MRIPRRYWRNLDWPLILSVLALTVIGLVVIYSRPTPSSLRRA